VDQHHRKTERTWVSDVLDQYTPPEGVEPGTDEFEKWLFEHAPEDVKEFRRAMGRALAAAFEVEKHPPEHPDETEKDQKR